MTNLEGKIAVVTGAGSGIGKAIATKLAEMGALVVCGDLNEETARATADSLPVVNDKQKHEAKKVDVADNATVKEFFDYIGGKFGYIDIACNNAGVSCMKTFEDHTEADWDFNMDINAKGQFLCMEAQWPYMKDRGARIINTASQAGYKTGPFFTAYVASKWASIGLTKNAAFELGKYDIRVNCLCPGYVKTSMQEREAVWEAELRGCTPEDVIQGFLDLTPLNRLCMPEDVANAVSWLVSDEGEFISGIALPVTGGCDLL